MKRPVDGRAAFGRVIALAAAALVFSLTACGGDRGAAGGAARGRGSVRDSVVGAARAAAESTPVAAGSDGGAASCTPRPLRALFMGTSLTAGLGLDPDQAYPALLQRRADSAGYSVRIVNAGVSGETSAGARRRADWILREPLDVFVLETGANDGLRAMDPDSTRANVQAILEKARAAHPGARLLLVQMEAPPNLGPDYTARFRAMFPSVARETGVTLVPFLLAGVAGDATLNQPDGIHPNVVGERRVAANVWPSLEGAMRALDPCGSTK